jgi:hypothetical protein
MIQVDARKARVKSYSCVVASRSLCFISKASSGCLAASPLLGSNRDAHDYLASFAPCALASGVS